MKTEKKLEAAIRILIAKVEDLEMVMQENASASYKKMIKEEETRKVFVDKAIKGSCDAHLTEDLFSYEEGEAGPGYHPELSCGKKLPRWQGLKDFGDTDGGVRIQGRFNFLGECVSDLYLVCSHFADIGEDYYVFWSHTIHAEKDFFDWVIWTPNSEHYNK